MSCLLKMFVGIGVPTRFTPCNPVCTNRGKLQKYIHLVDGIAEKGGGGVIPKTTGCTTICEHKTCIVIFIH